MIADFFDWLQTNAQYAHYAILGATLLAGLNIPIPIDLLMVISASIAAVILPSHLFHLFFAMLVGCIISAWISYTLGRTLGNKLIRLPLLSKMFSQERMEKIQKFYKKRGPLALIIGRFIPFGVRNGLFMSSGMSKMPFLKFAIWDAIACTIWSVTTFSLYYALGKNIDLLYTHVKTANLIIFLGFSVTVIGIIWYKKRKKATAKN